MNWQERAERAEAELARLREQEPVAMISKNDAGQISIKNPDGTFFDISKNVGCQFYAAPVPAVAAPLTPQADCRACVNRGRINGLSQETYCESCVHEGRNWRKNHFLDAVADRLLDGGE